MQVFGDVHQQQHQQCEAVRREGARAGVCRRGVGQLTTPDHSTPLVDPRSSWNVIVISREAWLTSSLLNIAGHVVHHMTTSVV